jgi:4-hydroxybenzoate polyprenyltransferase
MKGNQAFRVGDRLLAHIRLMRPYAWLWFDLLPASTLIVLLAPSGLTIRRLAAFLLAVVLADSGVSTLNDVCDVETDRRSIEASRRSRPVVTGIVSPRAAAIQSAMLLGASVLAAALASWRSAVALAAAMGIGVAYSVPPLRLCARPWASRLVWPVLGVTTYAAVAMFTDRWATIPAALYLLGLGFFYAIGETLAKDIRDWDNDRDGGRRTSVVVLGPKHAATCSIVAGLLGAVLLACLILWMPGMLPASRLGGVVVLAVWSVRAVCAVRRLRRTFAKSAARRLHVDYIRAYLAVNMVILLDAGIRTLVGTSTLR